MQTQIFKQARDIYLVLDARLEVRGSTYSVKISGGVKGKYSILAQLQMM
jgi:hypothetical protein